MRLIIRDLIYRSPLKNFESSFRHIRLFSMLFLGLCALVAVIAVLGSFRYAEKQREKIYVLEQGKSLMLALSQDLQQNRPVEAREHVRRFHELFFSLSPDKDAIEGNINRALLLADKSALSCYRDLQEAGYYNRLIAGNAPLDAAGRCAVFARPFGTGKEMAVSVSRDTAAGNRMDTAVQKQVMSDIR